MKNLFFQLILWISVSNKWKSDKCLENLASFCVTFLQTLLVTQFRVLMHVHDLLGFFNYFTRKLITYEHALVMVNPVIAFNKTPAPMSLKIISYTQCSLKSVCFQRSKSKIYLKWGKKLRNRIFFWVKRSVCYVQR